MSSDVARASGSSKVHRSPTKAAFIAAIVALAPLPFAGADSASATASPPADAPAVSLVGDSTMASMVWSATATDDPRDIVGNSYRLTFDAESCRRIIVTSCRGRFGSVPLSVLPLMQKTLRGKLGVAMVVMAGYDDPSVGSEIDQVVAEAESQGVAHVLWLSHRTNTTYTLPGGPAARSLYLKHNADLAAAAQRHSDLQILDWDAFSNDHPEWFASDGIHPTAAGAHVLATFIKDGLDGVADINRCRASRALTGSIDTPAGNTSSPSGRSGFVALTPKRLLDTRDAAQGGSNGDVGAGRTVAVDVGATVPADAVAVALSVTAVDSCAAGFLTVFGCGTRPPTSSVNFEVGRTTAGMAISPTASGPSSGSRFVCIYSSAATDVVVDLTGAFTPSGAAFHIMAPTRWIDTRGANVQLPRVTGARSAPTETALQLRGEGGIPTTATAVWLNLTAADPTADTVLSAYPGPCGSPPLASSVNARPGHSTASSVLVGIGSDGTVCVRTYSGSSQIVSDVAGWFGPGAGGLRYRSQAAVRLADTRTNSAAPTSAEQPVPIGAVSVLNITAADSTALGFVSVRPCGSSLISSLINTSPAEDTANVTAVAPDGQGNVCVQASTPSQLVVDQVGTFVP